MYKDAGEYYRDLKNSTKFLTQFQQHTSKLALISNPGGNESSYEKFHTYSDLLIPFVYKGKLVTAEE